MLLTLENGLNIDLLFPEKTFYRVSNASGYYKDFETLCNYFRWYNCNKDTGHTIAFYIKTV